MAVDPMTAGLDLAKTIVQTIWPDKSEEEKQQLAAALALVQGQMDINKAEAASSSAFVARWRPFIGWVCGAGCAWNWIGLPVASFGLSMLGYKVGVYPADLSEMMPLLLGMLGIGGLRTIEKVKGVAR
jgi:hypothetical protein